MVPHSATHRNHFLPNYPKESIIFPYLRQNHPTPSVLNNPDTDSYQDFNSNSLHPDGNSPFEQFESHISIKRIAFSKANPIFILLIKTFLLLLVHMIILKISLTLLTPILKCCIILFVILPPFQIHFLVLLTRLNVYISTPPVLKLYLLKFELLTPHRIYARFLLKTTTLQNLLVVSHLEIIIPSPN